MEQRGIWEPPRHPDNLNLPPLTPSSIEQERWASCCLIHHGLPLCALFPDKTCLGVGYTLCHPFEKLVEGLGSIHTMSFSPSWPSRNFPGSCPHSPSGTTLTSGLLRGDLLTPGLAGHPWNGTNPSSRLFCLCSVQQALTESLPCAFKRLQSSKDETITSSTDHVHPHTWPRGDAKNPALTAEERAAQEHFSSGGESSRKTRSLLDRQGRNAAAGRTGNRMLKCMEIRKHPRQLEGDSLFLPLPSFLLLLSVSSFFSLPASFTSSQGSTARGSWPMQTLRGLSRLNNSPCSHHNIENSQAVAPPHLHLVFLPLGPLMTKLATGKPVTCRADVHLKRKRM